MIEPIFTLFWESYRSFFEFTSLLVNLWQNPGHVRSLLERGPPPSPSPGRQNAFLISQICRRHAEARSFPCIFKPLSLLLPFFSSRLGIYETVPSFFRFFLLHLFRAPTKTTQFFMSLPSFFLYGFRCLRSPFMSFSSSAPNVTQWTCPTSPSLFPPLAFLGSILLKPYSPPPRLDNASLESLQVPAPLPKISSFPLRLLW